eukprot:scaffold65295_cov21-Tisochrysis_lutea.AAC.1
MFGCTHLSPFHADDDDEEVSSAPSDLQAGQRSDRSSNLEEYKVRLDRVSEWFVYFECPNRALTLSATGSGAAPSDLQSS